MKFIFKKKDSFRLKRFSKSGILIALLTCFSIIIVFCFSFISFTFKKYYRGDALIVNKLGQVRGSIQRYSKLKLFCEELNKSEICKEIEGVRAFIDSTLKYIESHYIADPEFSEIKSKVGFSDTYLNLKEKWKELQIVKDKKELLKESENIWNLADSLVYKAQKVSEIKEKELSLIVDFIRNGILLFIIFLMIAVYFLVRKNLEKDVLIDKLTLLYNRHSFDDELKRKVWISRKDGNPISIVVIDIDFFKQINDTFGHLVGDKVLHKVAQIIREQIRNDDIAFRFGGEEFIVILPGTGKEEAKSVAERIRKAVENTDFGIGRKVTVSCGIAEYSPGETLEQFIDKADKALYRAKNSGRNRCELG